MIDLVRKSMLTGLGIASITKDKIEEIARELIKQGEVSEQEGRKFVDEMMGYVDKTKKDMEKYFDNNLEKALKKLDLVRKKDLKELKQSIAEIQQKLDAEKQE